MKWGVVALVVCWAAVTGRSKAISFFTIFNMMMNQLEPGVRNCGRGKDVVFFEKDVGYFDWSIDLGLKMCQLTMLLSRMDSGSFNLK